MKPTEFFFRRILLLVIFVSLTQFVGCIIEVSRVTLENYDRIEPGMSRSEVEALLGKGIKQMSFNFGGDMNLKATNSINATRFSAELSLPQIDSETVYWKDGTKLIAVMFSDDEVAYKGQIGL